MKGFLSYALLIGTAALVGTAGGVFIKRVVIKPEMSMDNLSIESYLPNIEEIKNRVENYKGGGDIVDALSSSDIVNYSLEKYRNCENCYSYGTGMASTIVDQKIKSYQIKIGNVYQEESVSKSSMVGISNRTMQEGKEATSIKLNQATSAKEVDIDSSYVNVTYDTNTQTLDKNEYKEAYGRTLDEMFIYIISDKTVLSNSTNKTSDGYEIKVSLHTVYSTYYYMKQMKTISSLDKYPTFSKVTLTFTIGKDLTLKSMHADEEYTAKMKGINANIKNDIDYYYFANAIYSGGILDLNTSFDYFGSER